MGRVLRGGGWAAWPLCVVSLGLVTAATLLALGNGTDARSLGHLPFVAVCAVVAAVIEAGRPGNAVGRLLALGGFAFAQMEACGEYAELGGVCTVEPRPGGGTLVRATLPAAEGPR